jgi:hypothetical protein
VEYGKTVGQRSGKQTLGDRTGDLAEDQQGMMKSFFRIFGYRFAIQDFSGVEPIREWSTAVQNQNRVGHSGVYDMETYANGLDVSPCGFSHESWGRRH